MTRSLTSPNGSTPALPRQAVNHRRSSGQAHKAFDDCRFIGLALDGTGAGRSHQKVAICAVPFGTRKGDPRLPS